MSLTSHDDRYWPVHTGGTSSFPATPDTPEVASNIHTSGEWHAQRLMEEGARRQRLQDAELDILDLYELGKALNRCPICWIYIGEKHYEQELFVLPLYQQWIKLAESQCYFELGVIAICGSCARNQNMSSDSFYHVITGEDWKGSLASLSQVVLRHQLTHVLFLHQCFLLFQLGVLVYHFPIQTMLAAFHSVLFPSEQALPEKPAPLPHTPFSVSLTTLTRDLRNQRANLIARLIR